MPKVLIPRSFTFEYDGRSIRITNKNAFDLPHTLGLQQIGRGTSRAAYRLDDNYVLKLEGPGHGRDYGVARFRGQSAHEVSVYRQAVNAGLADRLARIYAAGDKWSVQEYIVPYKGYYSSDQLRRALEGKLPVRDFHDKNYGHRKDQPGFDVAFDYGYW